MILCNFGITTLYFEPPRSCTFSTDLTIIWKLTCRLCEFEFCRSLVFRSTRKFGCHKNNKLPKCCSENCCASRGTALCRASSTDFCDGCRSNTRRVIRSRPNAANLPEKISKTVPVEALRLPRDRTSPSDFPTAVTGPLVVLFTHAQKTL